MALTSCRECGGQLSTSANACPHCGYLPLGTRATEAITSLLDTAFWLGVVIVASVVIAAFIAV